MENNNDKNMKSMFLDILPEKDIRYVIFGVVIILFLLNLTSIIVASCYGGIYGGENIFRKYDVTGYGELILDILLVMFCVIVMLTCIKSFKFYEGVEKYNFNKIIALVFILFSIIPIICFAEIRNLEEKQSLEYKDTIILLNEKKDEIVENTENNESKDENSENSTGEQKELTPSAVRKYEIVNQIENNNFYNKLFNSFGYYQIRFGHMNKESFSNEDKKLSNTNEILYYCTFFEFSIYSFISGLLYAFSCKKTKKLVFESEYEFEEELEEEYIDAEIEDDINNEIDEDKKEEQEKVVETE